MTPYIIKNVTHYCNVSVTKCSQIPPQLITFYDLTFVIKGTMTYVVNGERVEICENDAILLPPGTQRRRFEGRSRVDYISFNFQVFPERELKTPLFMKNVITSDIKNILNVFPQKRLSSLYYSKEKLINLLNYILFEILESDLLKSNVPHIIKIKKFIDENVHMKITLKMISDHVHLTEEYVSYVFKKHTGKTVTEYINERKMIFAKKMIDNREMALKDIADNLGFENYGYFSRVFKKHFGTPPVKVKTKKQ